jgi:PAS domain S-box-containing protein
MPETFLSSYPFATALVSAEGKFLVASPAFPAMVGMSMENFLNITYKEITHPDDLALDIEQHQQLIEGKIKSYIMRKRYQHQVTGEFFWVLLQVGLSLDDPTGPVWAHATKIESFIPQLSMLGLYQSVWAGLRGNEMELHYQPIISLTTKEVVAYESLIRWTHNGRIKMPDDWLPQLDATIFPDVCCWAFRRLCEDRKNWNGPAHIAFAANVSPISLSVEGFADRLMSIPASVGYGDKDQRSHIWLEITEQAAISSNGSSLVKTFINAGHVAVIDDFGVGHSNLMALASYGAQLIKIDKSIIRELPGQAAVQMVILIVGLGARLKFATVAEGVEDQETATLLGHLGVDFAQGWLYGKPLPLYYWQEKNLFD